MHRARDGESTWASQALSERAALPNIRLFTNPEALRTLFLWGFFKASLLRHDWVNLWALVTELSLHPPPPPRRSGGEGSNPLIMWRAPLISKSHLINRPIMHKRHQFHLYVSEGISGTGDKRPNIITENAPIALITQEIPRVLGDLCKAGMRPNIHS